MALQLILKLTQWYKIDLTLQGRDFQSKTFPASNPNLKQVQTFQQEVPFLSDREGLILHSCVIYRAPWRSTLPEEDWKAGLPATWVTKQSAKPHEGRIRLFTSA